ncbi:YhdH/YhfP family quinone oxidoreductase [Gilvimarinus sp. SDUM040013]|uniref:YhdH/YhfP family quinone oxidoreductase n=1 Tax=Gilvimarinus gilvus TaxID=3058038 RepID=A0ABU4RYK3_9GAMM|nr:YhdH/YhfP family quinone oxidoreductase [Gilvimarinus sp. SDUM040013]MDO3385683.1 YhdH/YhfP family quinone oxidoreductase [Gilvimarinus sp. SDUM040013]MDX6849321.1 YhdH/YhfP family quinone oxidoreductase [Gilvimarinus sp. SDUM040013]
MKEFRAIRVATDGTDIKCQLETINSDQLPASQVLIKVVCSSLNYKDALSASGHKGVTRALPHTPGIDAAGIVVEDLSGRFEPGARVIVSGFDFGMNSDGGLAEYCKAPVEWVCPCPDNLSFYDSMALGTAGITVALALQKIDRQLPINCDNTKFVVSGASGGVGSMAIKIASAHGYSVTAITSRENEFQRLQKLGARQCVLASEWSSNSEKPLLKPEFTAGLDTVGGPVLVNLLKAIAPEGALACCGMALSANFCSTVFPFILRGVSLLGVDSAEIALSEKASLWQSLADLNLKFDDVAEQVSLRQVPALLRDMQVGKGRGRKVVRIAEEES